ncbi:hypothetical protein BDR06DRAFT_962466 [Suillus hirtellus]|nr:hypothetical protein BDR06DRAFT_962466 [Suillus hirtellus]
MDPEALRNPKFPSHSEAAPPALAAQLFLNLGLLLRSRKLNATPLIVHFTLTNTYGQHHFWFKKPPTKPSDPYANYSTAASLGYADPNAERAWAEAQEEDGCHQIGRITRPGTYSSQATTELQPASSKMTGFATCRCEGEDPRRVSTGSRRIRTW